jgi:hypothetical protein
MFLRYKNWSYEHGEFSLSLRIGNYNFNFLGEIDSERHVLIVFDERATKFSPLKKNTSY